MKFGVPDSDFLKIINEIKNNLGKTLNPKIYIYGSRVKGSFRKFSDIDLLLIAESYDEAELAKMNFSDLDTPYIVDFVLDKDLFEKYRDEIHSHMVELS